MALQKEEDWVCQPISEIEYLQLKKKSNMKESINITIDAVQKKRLMKEAHKHNLSLKGYLRLLVINS